MIVVLFPDEGQKALTSGELKLLTSLQACKTRAILTAEQAIKIFKIKLSNQTATKSQILSPCNVARLFGVSEKAVRDIWKGRTWLRETMHLDPARIVMAARLRPPGRPRLNLQVANASTELPSMDQVLQRADGYRHPGKNVEQISRSPSPGTAVLMSISTLSKPEDVLEFRDNMQTTSLSKDLCSDDAATIDLFDFSSLRSWSVEEEAAPLPESSRIDDPFHDDWRYWPKLEETRGESPC